MIKKLAQDTLDLISSMETMVDQQNAAREQIKAQSLQIADLENKVSSLPRPSKYVFHLENGQHGYADESWANIVREGQRIQSEFWAEAEGYWSGLFPSPSGKGWHGTSSMPVIQIVCQEPEYWFRHTVRLPGRFQVTCPSRWGSILRFRLTSGDHGNIKDTTNYGFATEAPIGIYVEPSTMVGDMTVRPFEQGIENVVIQGLGGTLPVYLAQNQDRFWMERVKILQHSGANIGVKHGPLIPVDEGTYQIPGGNVWLTDARFTDIQHEGPHSGARKQCSMLLSGANTIISNLNLYGWGQGPVIHNDEGLLINGMTMHDADGKFYPPSQMLPYAVSRVEDRERAVITGVNGPNDGWYLKKRSPAPATMGFYEQGQPIL